MIGPSLLPLTRGEVERVYSETDVICYEPGGNAALFQGDYKIVMNILPVGDGEWHPRSFCFANPAGFTKPDYAGTLLYCLPLAAARLKSGMMGQT